MVMTTAAIDFADLTDPVPALRKLLQKARGTEESKAAAGQGVTAINIGNPAPLPSWFRSDSVEDVIILLGAPVADQAPLLGLQGSLYLRALHGRTEAVSAGPAVASNPEPAQVLRCTLRGLLDSGLLLSAVPCEEGGLGVAVAQAGLRARTADGSQRPVGVRLDFSGFEKTRLDVVLFGEAPHRMVVTAKPLDAVKVIERSKLLGVPAARLGLVGGDVFAMQTAGGQFNAPLAELAAAAGG